MIAARLREERGSIAPMIPIMAIVLLLLGGLIVDASRQLNARGEAIAYADEAARAGAQGVSFGQNQLTLDPATARDRVQSYCDSIDNAIVTSCRFEGISAVSASDPRQLVVSVTVTTRIPTTLLGMVGLRSLTATGTGKARPVEGLTTGAS